MQALRTSKRIASLVLVWFGLFLGVAAASSLVKPDGLHLICSAGGVMKMAGAGSGTAGGTVAVGMDCPLCASVTAPPPAVAANFGNPKPATQTQQTVRAAPVAALAAPPMPSRGPPATRI